MVELADTRDLKSLAVKRVPVRSRLPAPNEKRRQRLLFLFGLRPGSNPSEMQVSGGHLLPPVQTLVATTICRSRLPARPSGGVVFLYLPGSNPSEMQVSSGHLLPPVQTLVATSIFLFRQEKEKCKSSPFQRFLQKARKCPVDIFLARGRVHG